jgi:hypothetical protein
MNVHHAELREPSWMHPTQATLQASAHQARQDAADVHTERLVLDILASTHAAICGVYDLHSRDKRLVHPSDIRHTLGDAMDDLRGSIAILEGRA